MSATRMSTILVRCCLVMTTWLFLSTFAFVPPTITRMYDCTAQLRLSPRYAGKGFGEDKKVPRRKRQQLEYTDQLKYTYNEESDRSVENPMRDSINTNEQTAGQKALFELRRQRVEQRNAELKQMMEMRRMDDLAKESSAVIPEKVAMRMGKRMLPFVGVPLFGGMGSFVTFWYLATQKNMEFQPTMVAFTTMSILVVGLLVRSKLLLVCLCFVLNGLGPLTSFCFVPFRSFHRSLCTLEQGITYSVMSTSWDPDREESGLGFDEFQKNVGILGEGLSRSRENALLRERMADMSEADIQAELKDLDTRDKVND